MARNFLVFGDIEGQARSAPSRVRSGQADREARPPAQHDEMAWDAKRRLSEAGCYRAPQSLRLGVSRSAEGSI